MRMPPQPTDVTPSAIGDWVYVARGDAVQSAVRESFTLA